MVARVRAALTRFCLEYVAVTASRRRRVCSFLLVLSNLVCEIVLNGKKWLANIMLESDCCGPATWLAQACEFLKFTRR